MSSKVISNSGFFASTRGQVVTLLRQGHATVEELARALGLTDNAEDIRVFTGVSFRL